ncbi:MAG: ribosome-associated translation inhibitor RaiA [Caulobacteraceae bacterium]|nr:MAG: ribosome-associated translation inhibitor RaiA [Caulobacteraceae bacterium]
MQIQVAGKQVDVGAALRDRITDDLSNSIGKYFDRGGAADVTVSRAGHGFRVDCALALDSGQRLQSHGAGGDAHAAFTDALGKIETRVRRYKRRLKDHSPAANAKQEERATYTTLRSPDDSGDDIDWDAEDGTPNGAPSAMVIAENDTQVKTLTVSGAVMELDLTESQTIVFRNAAHGGLSVVYRRADGNIGWIDPERTSRGGNNSSAKG